MGPLQGQEEAVDSGAQALRTVGARGRPRLQSSRRKSEKKSTGMCVVEFMHLDCSCVCLHMCGVSLTSSALSFDFEKFQTFDQFE